MACITVFLSFTYVAGEALGAIGCSSVINLLDEYAKDPVPEVRSFFSLLHLQSRPL